MCTELHEKRENEIKERMKKEFSKMLGFLILFFFICFFASFLRNNNFLLFVASVQLFLAFLHLLAILVDVKQLARL